MSKRYVLLIGMDFDGKSSFYRTVFPIYNIYCETRFHLLLEAQGAWTKYYELNNHESYSNSYVDNKAVSKK